jgi:ketosteroid isomerase-like protein
MAGSANKQVVLDYLAARESRDLGLLDRLVAEDFHHEMLGRRQDREGLFEEVAALPFASGTHEVDALVEEGDRVACRYRFRGTTLAGAPIEFTGMFIAVLRDGRLATGWGEYDAAAIARAMREPSDDDRPGGP